MTKQDLERALEQHVAEARLSDEALRNIRKAVCKEEKPVKRKMKMGLVLALTLLMLSATALAASGGFLELIGRLKGTAAGPLPEGEDLFEQAYTVCEDEYVTYTLSGAAYDGHAAGVVIEIVPKEADTLILRRSCVFGQCYRHGNKPCVPPLNAQHDEKYTPQENFSLIRRYAAENGYKRVVLTDVQPGTLNGATSFNWSAYSEWQGNRITEFLSLPVQGNLPEEILAGSVFFESQLYDDGVTASALEMPEQRMQADFTLDAADPLWTKQVPFNPGMDIAAYGLRIEQVRLTGTPLGVYADVVCTVTHADRAVGSMMTAVDAQDEFTGYGLIEPVSLVVPGGVESHTFRLSLPAMEAAPEVLRVKVFSPERSVRDPQTVEIPIR